eukprot:87274_1
MDLNDEVETILILNLDNEISTASPAELISIRNSQSFILSDADEELLILVKFKNAIDLHSICLQSNAEDVDIEDVSEPKRIHIYKTDHLNIDFDDIQLMKADKTIHCSVKKLSKGKTIKLQKQSKNAVRFKKTTYLVIYVDSNQSDTEKTLIHHIQFKGHVKNAQKSIQSVMKSSTMNEVPENNAFLQNIFIMPEAKSDIEFKEVYANTTDDITDYKCNLSYSQCNALKSLQTTLSSYICSTLDIELTNTLQALNDFLHLLQHHNDNAEIEFVYDQFDRCDINECVTLRRNYRDRSESSSKVYHNDAVDRKQIVYRQILDKIHCSILHCFDIGYRLSSKTINSINIDFKETSEGVIIDNPKIRNIKKVLRSKQNNMQKISRRNVRYNNFGSKPNMNDIPSYFSYGFCNNYDMDHYGMGHFIPRKHASLKQELINNIVFRVTSEQFYAEYQKAKLHCASLHNKKLGISLKLVLVTMFYCNYDALQYEFSKTFRYLHKKETMNQLIERHSNYHWFAKHLIEVAKKHGTLLDTGSVYHGVSEKLMFKYMESEVVIWGPVSTSLVFEVAVNFTNHNNGIIIDFMNNSYAEYVPVSWLSDYPRESECLFIGGKGNLVISNIIDASSCCEYGHIIKALHMVEYCTGFANLRSDIDISQKTLIGIVEHQLSLNFREYKKCIDLKDNKYAEHMVYRYFTDRDFPEDPINIDWNVVSNQPWFVHLFCYSKLEWIKVHLLDKLFSQRTWIDVFNIQLCESTLKNILNCIEQLTFIREINIYDIKSNSTITMDEAISTYSKEFTAKLWGIGLKKTDEKVSVALSMKANSYRSRGRYDNQHLQGRTTFKNI